jgi:hypothetical protein
MECEVGEPYEGFLINGVWLKSIFHLVTIVWFNLYEVYYNRCLILLQYFISYGEFSE